MSETTSPEGDRGQEFEMPPRELIEGLEKAPLNAVLKEELVMIMAGLRPATDASFSQEGTNQEALRAYLESAGLPYRVVRFKGDEETLAIGKTPEDLERMSAALATGDDVDLGRAYGFPETAIQSFVSSDRLSVEEFNMLVPDPELRHFTDFVPSASHWEEDMRFIRRRLSVMKRVSPTILRQLYEKTGGNPDWVTS